MGPVGLILDSHTAPQIVRHRPSDWNTLDCFPQIFHPHPPRPESLSVFPGLPTVQIQAHRRQPTFDCVAATLIRSHAMPAHQTKAGHGCDGADPLEIRWRILCPQSTYFYGPDPPRPNLSPAPSRTRCSAGCRAADSGGIPVVQPVLRRI